MIEQGELEWSSSNKFKVLTNQIIRTGIPNVGELKNNKKMILREVKEDERWKEARKELKEIKDVRRTNKFPSNV